MTAIILMLAATYFKNLQHFCGCLSSEIGTLYSFPAVCEAKDEPAVRLDFE